MGRPTVAFRFPMTFSGYADVVEWFDEDEGRFRIDVRVSNSRWGPLFGYRGSFDVDIRPCAPDSVPDHVKPHREESRE